MAVMVRLPETVDQHSTALVQLDALRDRIEDDKARDAGPGELVNSYRERLNTIFEEMPSNWVPIRGED